MDATITFRPRSGEPDATKFYLEAVMSSGGTVTSYTRQRGITSLSRSSQGVYVLTLYEPAQALLGLSLLVQKTTEVGRRVEVKSHTITTTGAITLNVYDHNSAGNLRDLTSCTIRITVEVLGRKWA